MSQTTSMNVENANDLHLWIEQHLFQEPWVKLANGKDLTHWGHEQEVMYNQIHRQLEKYRFFIHSFDMLKDNGIQGHYFEFGCHRGRTFRMALTEARRHNMNDMKFFAFDSFEGLPPNDGSHGFSKRWVAGGLSTSVEAFQSMMQAHGIYIDRIEIIKGFYHESLTKKLQSDLAKQNAKASLVTIDCDLYESAVPVFAFLEPFLQEGTILYIDDWFTGYKGSPLKGISRAYKEFEKTSRLHFAEFLPVGWWGRSFIAYEPHK